MTNGDRGGWLAGEILRAIASEYGWPALQPAEKTVVRVDRAALAPLAGRYELRPDKILAVVLENGTLFVVDGDEKVELYPESETRFFEMVESNTIEFLKGPDGRAMHMVINGELKAPRR